jgi:cytochrome P450
MVSLPPGPKLSLFDQLLYRPGRNPLDFFPMLARRYGDLAAFRMGGETVVFVNHPQYIKDILVTHNRKFIKGRGLESAKRLLGQGLLTSEDPVHLRQRRLLQPAFHRERIESYGTTMVQYAERMRQGWTAGEPIDIAQEMMRLTLSIAGKTLFDVDVQAKAADVGRALTAVMNSFWTTMLPFIDVLERLPVPQLRRARTAREQLDAMIYRLIAERRAEGAALERRGDLLSMLLLAQDEEDQHRGMTDQQVRDEAMTIFLDGHETTANALTWTWFLLSGVPEVERCLHLEVDRVLQGRAPTVADLPALRFVEQVVTESMRLYPPAWLIGRRAVEEYRIADYRFPPRTIFVTSPYVTQRDPRFFPDPDRFDPSRWTPAFRSTLPLFAYFPFGGGPRRCIGESFAWMELILVVATLAQRWSLRLVPGHPVVAQPVVTLRTKHGVRMVPENRDEPAAA